MTNLETKILELKEKNNAVILAHFYQDEEIQDIADFVGDSLDLSRKAATTDCDTIVFCGVKFMAEVAKILNPQKNVIIPDMKAGCSLETSCPTKKFLEFKKGHPSHFILSYINCSAEIKALSDVIVTSSNAKKIIDQLPKDQKIIFAPDQHLGSYLNKITGRDMLLWPGSCIVHETFSEREIVKMKIRNPGCEIIAHPECPDNVLSRANFIGSTSALLNHVRISNAQQFIIATEPHIIHQMKKIAPKKSFLVAPGQNGNCSCSNCPYMELNTMEKLYMCLKNGSPSINLEQNLLNSAKKPLERMLSMS